MTTSEDAANYVARPDYRKVALAYEECLAEAPADDAVLDTLRRTLEVYEQEIRAYPRERLVTLTLPDRLALAARLAGGFKPRDRGELGELMAALVNDFEAYEEETERRIENAKRGTMPEGTEDAWHPLAACAGLLSTTILDGDPRRAPTAEGRRYDNALMYLAEQLNEHVATLQLLIYGFDADADDDDDGQDEIG